MLVVVSSSDDVAQGLILHWRELILRYATQWAFPVIGQILKRCAWSYTAIGIALCRVIYMATYIANVLFHNSFFVIKC